VLVMAKPSSDQVLSGGWHSRLRLSQASE